MTALQAAPRRQPLPRSEPPTSSRMRLQMVPRATVQEALPLRLGPGVGPLPTDTATQVTPATRTLSRTAQLPPARPWIAQLAQGVAEVMLGHRPARQMARWTDERVFRELTRAGGRGLGPEAPPGSRARVTSVRATLPEPDIIEGVALMQVGPRVRALALRTEALRGRWVCTACDLL